MDALRNLRDRSRTFIEQQRQLLENQPPLQFQFGSLGITPGKSSTSSSGENVSKPGAGGAGGDGPGSPVSSLPGSPSNSMGNLSLTASLSASTGSLSGGLNAAEEEEETTVVSDKIPRPHPSLDDGTVIKAVLVRAYETRHQPKTHIVYILDVCTLTNSWTVCRRYSDFVELHNRLKRRFGGIQTSLPPKDPFNKFAERILETRKMGLENYLKTIISVGALAKSEEVYSFLEIHLYDVAAVVNMLALEGLTGMDGFLEDNQFRFPLNPTFLYCISARIHQLYPDYHRGFDFTLVPTDQPSHIMRFAVFVQKLKTLKLSNGYWKRPAADPTEEYSSYRDPTFDISVFESAKILQIRDFNLSLFRNMHAIQQQILEIECVSNNLESFRDLLINFANISNDSRTVIAKSWPNLRRLCVSKNKLREFDDSLALIPNLGELDVSYNEFRRIENLQFLLHLHKLDISFNKISSLDSLNTILGNIRTLTLANNEIEFLQGAEKLYSLQHLDLSNNKIVELNESNRLGELPFLEQLFLKGNVCAEQKSYRAHVLANFGDRSHLVALDGETMHPREKDEVLAIQEKIKQERAKVTTKSLIAKKKTKTKVAEILPPKKKKEKKSLSAELGDLDHEFNVNGISVAESINQDVEKILAGITAEAHETPVQGTNAAKPSSVSSPRLSSSLEPEGSHRLSLDSLEQQQIQAEIAREQEKERERLKEEERAKAKELEKEKERERKRLEKQRALEQEQENERRKGLEVSSEMTRVVEKLRSKEDVSSDSPISFIGCFNENDPDSRYYSIFNFDLESNAILEIDEDTGKLKGNWPFSVFDFREMIKKGRARLQEGPKDKPSLSLLLCHNPEPLRSFSLENMQAFTDVCALMTALIPLVGESSPPPSRPMSTQPSGSNLQLSDYVDSGPLSEQVDLGIDKEFTDMVANFLRSNAGVSSPQILACFWAHFLMLQASNGKERLCLVVALKDRVFLLSSSPTKKDLETKGSVLLTIMMEETKQITVGFFDQYVRLETNPKTTVTVLTRNAIKTSALISAVTDLLSGKPHVRYITADVADELMSYLSFEDPSLGLRILDYMLPFQKQRDSLTGAMVQIPRTLLLTETALYLLDEDLSGWPHPLFLDGYNYRLRPPYRTLSQFPVTDLICVELSKSSPTSFNLIFEDKTPGQPAVTWELVCTRGKQRTQFLALLNATWNRLFQSDILVTEF